MTTVLTHVAYLFSSLCFPARALFLSTDVVHFWSLTDVSCWNNRVLPITTTSSSHVGSSALSKKSWAPVSVTYHLHSSTWLLRLFTLLSRMTHLFDLLNEFDLFSRVSSAVYKRFLLIFGSFSWRFSTNATPPLFSNCYWQWASPY